MRKQIDKPEIITNIIGDIAKSTGKAHLISNYFNDVFLGNFSEEVFSSNTFGRIIRYICKKSILIDDCDEAFRQLLSTACFITVCDAFNTLGFKINTSEFVMIQVQLIEAIKNNLAEDFDLFSNNFLKNKAVSQCEEIIEVFLMNYEEGEQKEIRTYVREMFEICFYEVLDEQYITFEKYSQYIKSKNYILENRNSKLKEYKAKLKNMYWQSVMQDEKGMRLADIYIEPEFRVHRICFYENDTRIIKKSEFIDGFSKEIGGIHSFIKKTLNGENPLNLKVKQTNLIFVMGYPGQGKTSMCRRIVHDFLTEKMRGFDNIYYIPLRRLDVGSLINAPMENIRKFIINDIGINEVNLENSLVILDGLDEIYIHGIQLAGIDNFCDKLSWELGQMPDIKMIITSRYGYVDIQKLSNCGALVLNIKEMNSKMQEMWLDKFSIFHQDIKLTKNHIKMINNQNEYEHIRELIQQPILLYIIVVSRINIDIGDSVNRAKIYKALFDSLIERKWSNCEKASILKNITAESLRMIIGSIAFAIQQTGEEYILKSNLMELEDIKKFNEKIGDGKQFAESLKGIMITFYFQEVECDSYNNTHKEEYAVEFLHKSLQEYMVAERIWIKMKKFCEVRKNEEYFVNSLDDAYQLLSTLFAKKYLSREIIGYLFDIIKNDTETDKELLFKRLFNFQDRLLEKNFFDNRVMVNKHGPLDVILATFYGYWTIISIIANFINFKGQYIQSQNKDMFTFLVKCLIAKRLHSVINFSYQVLNGVDFCFTDLTHADLSDADLSDADLSGANLSGANLSGANLSRANLSRANFSSADLSGAKFYKVNLINLDLRTAKLSGADLSQAIFEGVDFRKINLIAADLSKANLKKMDLRKLNMQSISLCEADLSNSNLSGADLRWANLSRTKFNLSNLEGTYLNGCNLSEANLSGANLKMAYLNDANLRAANLVDTILYRGKLNKADLQKVNLRGADLRGADLNGANLRNADLSGVDFSDADLNLADFSGANLSGVKFCGAALHEAIFHKTNLLGADFTKAVLSGTGLQKESLIRAGVQKEKLVGINFDATSSAIFI